MSSVRVRLPAAGRDRETCFLIAVLSFSVSVSMFIGGISRRIMLCMKQPRARLFLVMVGICDRAQPMPWCLGFVALNAWRPAPTSD
ncbi:hypothetical protein BJX63DRAFT_384524 [Aspergillus granulosus]|uniref:Uncharacterized protein n=1 Tax=Aspergillus granulosus TaxID=176169 RepID=A0ABR4HRG1_9EURO